MQKRLAFAVTTLGLVAGLVGLVVFSGLRRTSMPQVTTQPAPGLVPRAPTDAAPLPTMATPAPAPVPLGHPPVRMPVHVPSTESPEDATSAPTASIDELRRLTARTPAQVAEQSADLINAHGLEDPRDAIGPYTTEESQALDQLDDQIISGEVSLDQWRDKLITILGKARAEAYLASGIKSGQALSHELLTTGPDQ